MMIIQPRPDELTIHRRLTEIKSSVACNATTNRNFLVRITDAERIAGKLKDVWTEVQAAYNELIVSHA
jgi:hypothetical protein